MKVNMWWWVCRPAEWVFLLTAMAVWLMILSLAVRLLRSMLSLIP